MTWREKAIEAWYDWQNARVPPGTMIPALEQVGKLLLHHHGNEQRVEQFIYGQIELDRVALWEGYWEKVLEQLHELQVNDLIMAE